MGLLHVAGSPLNSSVVFAVTRLFSRWFQSMAVHMNKEFLYCSVLGCSITTTIYFILFILRMNTDTDTDTDIYTMYIPADTINIVSFEPYT
jgi:hypothetical protein